MECICCGPPRPRLTSIIIFLLFVLGWVLLCSASVLSVYGFRSCQSGISICGMYKLLGPVLAGIGLASIIMAEFTARQARRRRESTGDRSNPDSRFLHGKSRQFVQYLTLGILFMGCGILIAIPGIVIPRCKPVPKTATAPGFCETRSVQISGLVIALVGLFFCLLARLTKNHLVDDVPESEELPRDQPFSIMLEGEVFTFPPPPPPYFPRGRNMSRSEDPPPYYSMYNKTYNDGSSRRTREAIPLPGYSTNEGFPSEPPPSYTELYPSQPEPADN